MEWLGSLLDLRVLLTCVVVFLTCFFLLSRKRRNLPPSPSRIPFIGDSLWFNLQTRKRNFLGRAIYEESKRLGNVVGLKLGSQQLVYLIGYDMIHDTFVKRGQIFSERPNWLPGVQKGIKEGKGVIWQNGHHWKIMRRFTLQAFRDFGVGKTSLEEKIFVEVEAASELFAGSDGKPVSVRHLTSMMIVNVIIGIVFGRRYDYGDETFDDLIERLDSLFRVNPRSDLSPITFFSKLFKTEAFKRRLFAENNIDWIKEYIKTAVREHELSFDVDNIRDFIDLYIEAERQESANPGEKLHSFGNIFRLIMDLFIAGSETTSNTINWSILYVMEYPEVQARCQREILEFCGERNVTYEDRKSLPYVEATLLEVQRIATIAAMTVPHTTIEDTTIGGYFVPARSIIQANLLSSHMDPKHWDQPEVFNPERFLDQEGNLKKNPALIPFSTGPRVCVGESLAKMEIFLTFSNLVSRFTFQREDASTKLSFDRDPLQITSAPLPYKTRAVRRAT